MKSAGETLLKDAAHGTMSETVSIIVTVYNDSEFLQDAIESILAQTRPVDEIIVVDDGSRPELRPDTSQWPDVKLLRKPNGGLSSARNYLMQIIKRTQ